MKEYIALLLALCLLTAGCGKGQEAPTEPLAASTAPTTQATEEPTAPETTAPKTREIQVMGDSIPVIRLLLQQGQTLEVTGYEGTDAKVTAGEEQGLVESGFLRFPDEPFERRTAYALWNAGLYPDFSCLGEPLERLATNTKLEVLEELENCLYVQAGEQTGFVPLAQQSRYPYQPPADSGDSRPSGGSGGSGPQDGGDITLMHPGQLRLLADTVKTGEAKVKVSGVPLVLRFCNYGDTVSVLESGRFPEIPGYTAILESDGTTAYIPTAWLADAQTFTPWDGYAGNNCKLYEHYLLLGKEVRSLYTNKPLTVLWDSGLTALVQADGERFYAASATLMKTPLVVPPAPESDSGGSSGGSSDLWTPPVL